jgi:arylsulfatase A-like enzyme
MLCGLRGLCVLRGAVALGFLAALATLAAAADRPNIVFIMSDDHAAHAIGAYGSRVNRTPNIDRLAREGALLEQVMATNSICTPSRAAILTSQYSHLNGVPVFNRFDSSRRTVASLLQQGGYYTGMIGKWHLGSDPVGFDRWEILPGQGAYQNPILYTATGEKTYTGRYATDVITDLSIEFIRGRPRNKPFFLMSHHKAPHRPWEPDEAHRAAFANRWIPEPDTFWDAYDTRTDALHENLQRVAADLNNRDLKLPPPPDLTGPALTTWLTTKPASVTIRRSSETVTLTGEALARWKYQRYMQDYLATVQSLDDNIGRLLAFLDESGSRATRSSSTPAIRASSSAITASSTSASCTKKHCGCRSSRAGPPPSNPAHGAARSR